MSLRGRIRDWLFETRSNLANPDPWLAAAFGGPMTATGIRVNADTAMRFTAVYAAVRILAETVATLPLIVYRRTENDGKERATDYFLYRLLHDQPNEEQTSVEFREMLQGHLALRGNAYAQIDRKMGQPARLVPLHPDRVEVERGNRRRAPLPRPPGFGKPVHPEPAAGRDPARPGAFLGRRQGPQPDRALPGGDRAGPGLRGVLAGASSATART